LCIVGGRLVTDENGAPCACGPSGPTGLPDCILVAFPGLVLTQGRVDETFSTSPIGSTSRLIRRFINFSIDLDAVKMSGTPQIVNSRNYQASRAGFFTWQTESTSQSPGFPPNVVVLTDNLLACFDIRLVLIASPSGAIHVDSVSIGGGADRDPPVDNDGFPLTNIDVFYFESTDPLNSYFNDDHEEGFKNRPKFTDPVPNLHTDNFPLFGDLIFATWAGNFGNATLSVSDNCGETDLCEEPRPKSCRACEDPNDSHTLPITGIPSDALTFRVGDTKYDLQRCAFTDDPPSPIDEFLTQPCDGEPPVEPDFAIATRCPTSNPFDLANSPAQIVYAVNPGVGVGNGTVGLLRLFNEPCPPPQGDRQCQRIIRYLPTSTPADGPAEPGATHAPGVPCAPNQTICEDCEDIVAPSIESMTDRNNRILREQGFDAAKETRALKQGGDCGCSQYTYS